MTADSKNRIAETVGEPRIKTLHALKQRFRGGGVKFIITAHARQESVGEERTVTRTMSTGFYSKAEGGKEMWCEWSTAKHWEFGDVCSIYVTPEKKSLIMSFRLEGFS